MDDIIEAWESLKETLPSDHAEAASRLWDAGDALADEVERLTSRVAALEAEAQELRLELITAHGQAQEAHEARLAAEARVAG